jgi:hypothetical protein
MQNPTKVASQRPFFVQMPFDGLALTDLMFRNGNGLNRF